MIGVLVAVLSSVGVVALTGTVSRPVSGIAVPASAEPPSTVPSVPAPAAEASAATPETSVPGASVPEASVPGPTARGVTAAPETNPLTVGGVALPEVWCELPALARSRAALREFYLAGLRCLDEAWRPAVEGVGVRFRGPGLEVAPGVVGGCAMPDERAATAFYCGADEVVHMPAERLLRRLDLYLPGHLGVLAHEYGHHVQNLTGILSSAAERLAEVAPGSPAEWELTRRIELQAHCFAGLFLAGVAGRGSLSRAQAVAAVNEFARSADSDTHGTVVNQMRWVKTGFRADTTAACDTWSVPAAAVA